MLTFHQWGLSKSILLGTVSYEILKISGSQTYLENKYFTLQWHFFRTSRLTKFCICEIPASPNMWAFLVNIDKGSGLLPDSTKPLSKPILTNHQWGLVAFAWAVWYKTKFGSQNLVANVSSQFQHLVNTGLAVRSLVKWLPVIVAHTCKLDTIWVVYISMIGNGSIRL